MDTNISRAQELLNKVYDHLDSIDVTKLSMRDLQDFLEVVQKGQFLESYGKASYPMFNGIGGFGGGFTKPPISTENETENGEVSGNK